MLHKTTIEIVRSCVIDAFARNNLKSQFVVFHIENFFAFYSCNRWPKRLKHALKSTHGLSGRGANSPMYRSGVSKVRNSVRGGLTGIGKKIWLCLILPCAKCLNLAFILVTLPDAGIRRWTNTSLVFDRAYISSIFNKPYR